MSSQQDFRAHRTKGPFDGGIALDLGGNQAISFSSCSMRDDKRAVWVKQASIPLRLVASNRLANSYLLLTFGEYCISFPDGAGRGQRVQQERGY
jgi:hypothetical protein